MNIWAARKGYGMMRAVASAIFRATASNMSARTRRKRSLLRSASVSCSVSLSVVRDSEWQGAGCAAAQLLRGTYKRCFRAALADQNIMSIETQKENLKQQEESREFLCIVSDAFRISAKHSSMVLGSAWTFASAILIIAIWGLTGPMFRYSDTWQLIINTGTTIVTFLMVFLIQNTQNRDAKAAHLKLDELIRALKGARNELIDLENLTDRALLCIRNKLSEFAKQQGGKDTKPAGLARRTAV